MARTTVDPKAAPKATAKKRQPRPRRHPDVCPDCRERGVLGSTPEGKVVLLANTYPISAETEALLWSVGANTFQVVGVVMVDDGTTAGPVVEWRWPGRSSDTSSEVYAGHVCVPQMERLAALQRTTVPPPRHSIWGAVWIAAELKGTYVLMRQDEDGIYHVIYDAVSSAEHALEMAVRLGHNAATSDLLASERANQKAGGA